MSLTDTAARNAKPTEKQYKLTDSDGLYLLVKPNGTKLWRFKYYYLGKEKLLAVGAYPETTLAEAREKRIAARKLLANNADPSVHRQQERRLAEFTADNTFKAVATEWFETHKPKWSADHAARLWRRIEANILNKIGDRPIAEIEALELLDTIRKVEKRGATELSHRLLHICGAIFRYAVLTKRTTYNPAQDLSGALIPHKAKNYPTIQAKELPNFFNQLKKVDASEQNKLAIRLLMLTFVRTGELRHSEWKDIDLEGKLWRLPAHTTKMKEEHVVPLSKQAIVVLQELKKLTGHGDLLFPSRYRRSHRMMSENTINHILRKMGYKDQLVGHGFRALASTTLNEKGFRPDVIEHQLAHMERNKVRAAYNRAKYLDERKHMMQWWADFLEGSNVKSQNVIVGKFRASK